MYEYYLEPKVFDIESRNSIFLLSKGNQSVKVNRQITVVAIYQNTLDMQCSEICVRKFIAKWFVSLL